MKCHCGKERKGLFAVTEEEMSDWATAEVERIRTTRTRTHPHTPINNICCVADVMVISSISTSLTFLCFPKELPTFAKGERATSPVGGLGF